ncbi:FAD-dependent monooxygenase [Leptospira ellisii]|uniref:FAD-dependent monooxygenase n=1 Tax=Leptospira ellisii TaxID=2023197 RepID=A0AAE4QQ37_9LEPT|nr:FAD-dependent monooxygenase [Leptospira ellisii]MDV6237159.1 FAD-dependent monooxygenase [Leptospira ellisii]
MGLFLACELALAECSVLILEKTEHPNSPLKKVPFGIRGLSAPTIEAFYRRGLLEELEIHKRLKNPHANVDQGSRRQVGHFAGIPFHSGDVDSSQWKYRSSNSTETSLLSEMGELETILTRRAEALGVKIQRGFALTSFDSTEDGVVVRSEDRIFQCGWLVGCDGSRSVVRKNGGFEFAGTEPEFTGYSVQVDLSDPEKLKPGRNATAAGMYLQSQPGYVILQDFDGGAFHTSEKPITLEHLQDVLRRVSGTDVTINTLYIATTWTDRARQATSYRNGRIFLAGDAAHIHAPLGGQGLNLGIGDAMNLGWKLAAAVRNEAPESLLDSYHMERHPIGVRVLDWSRAQVAIMRPDPHARALNAIVRDLMDTRDGATYFAGRVWGIDTRYDLGGDSPLSGRSVPDFEFEDGDRIGRSMYDGRAILLDFDGDVSLKTLAGGYGDRMKYVCAEAGVKERFGLNAALIRPDGIIAWVSESDPDYDGLENAAARWFVHRSSSGTSS